MSTGTSDWISFLRQYGPIPRNDNMYDEAIHRVLKRKNITPIVIESTYKKELIENFISEKPKSVILTGTAGDGKTFNCREVWLELNGSPEIWLNDEKLKSTDLPNGKKLTVIKDLSELQDQERQVLHRFVTSVLDPNYGEVFLVAANDGQLIEAWKHIDLDNEVIKVRACVEDLLVNDQQEKNGYHFKLYNLSRISAGILFPQIVNAILEHSGWDNCAHCPINNSEDVRCPIQQNRLRLKGELDEQLLEKRLTDLLELCELNGLHLPIRQLLLLSANMLLGHPEAKDNLMNCKDAINIVEKNTTHLASIYRNIFGENLPERRRESTDVFSALNKFGIGYETSNRVDSILIFGADDPDLKEIYQQLLLEDTYYGADQTFKAYQKEYLEGSASKRGEQFLNTLHGQRQRLFFVIPPAQANDLGLWELTTFQYAGEFLKDVYMTAKDGSRVSSQLTARLVKGLNRIFTGLLIKDDDKLILATSGSHSQSKVSRIYEESVSVPKKRGESIQIKLNKHGRLVVAVQLSPELGPVELPLQLVRYEFLSRVAEGALPGSFSKECYEDILGFKSKILDKLEMRRREEGDELEDEQLDGFIFKVIKLREGYVDETNVEVNYNA